MSAPPYIRPGATRRLELHTSNFACATCHLKAEEVGELGLMLMAEVAQLPVRKASNKLVAEAFAKRDDYRRIKGSFGRDSLPLATRRAVFDRDLATCVYCQTGLTWEIYHCDHVHPVSLGGGDELENLAASCETCNRSKGAKTLKDWRGVQ